MSRMVLHVIHTHCDTTELPSLVKACWDMLSSLIPCRIPDSQLES